MPLIWRAMLMEGGLPKVARDAKCLGVRVGDAEFDDIKPDVLGFVQPGQGGMSVAPDVDSLPRHRQPRRLRKSFPDRFRNAAGPNDLFCWQMGGGLFEAGELAPGLRLRLDPANPNKHAFVEPQRKMALGEYEAALSATRERWQRWGED